MTLDELVKLSRISGALRTSDPEFARTLSVLIRNQWRHLREAASVAILPACALLWLVGLATRADVAQRVRARTAHLGDVDLVFQEILVEVVCELEKQQRMLQVQLGERV